MQCDKISNFSRECVTLMSRKDILTFVIIETLRGVESKGYRLESKVGVEE